MRKLPPPSRLMRRRKGREPQICGFIHILAAAGDLRPGPAYVWGPLGTRAEYVKIMIQDHNAVPTAAATTLLVVKKCRGVTARLAGIGGEFTIQPLVVRGLTHPVNLGQHFLGCHWCSHGVHPARGLGAVRAAGGLVGKPTPMGQEGDATWRS